MHRDQRWESELFGEEGTSVGQWRGVVGVRGEECSVVVEVEDSL